MVVSYFSGSGSPVNPSWEAMPTTSQAPVAPAKQRHRRRIHRPTKNSLYDLFHEHAGISLFVRPIYWTDLHAQLLGTRWKELSPCDSPKPATTPGLEPSRGHLRPSHTITTLSHSLTQILLPDTMHPTLCSNAVKTVLMTLWPKPFRKPYYLPELHLYFGGRVYRDAVHAQIMWNFPPDESKTSYSSFRSVSTRPADSFNTRTNPCSPSPQGSTNLPMVCYVGKSQLANTRKDLFHIAPGLGRTNEPVYRLQQLRARLLVPSNSDRDAHVVGIFLAMAQKHFYPSPPPSSRRESPMTQKRDIPLRPNFQDVALRILTHDTDTSDFIVYTGYVTKEFLEKFHNPFKGPQGEEETELSGIRIEFTRVPIWPILGLRERLGKAFGQDVVGYFNHEEMETWDKNPEKQERGKRKREDPSKEAALAILNMFDSGAAFLVEGTEIDRPRNALTLTHRLHGFFGDFQIYFESVDQELHTYQINTFIQDIMEYEFPITRTLYLTESRTIDPPSPRLLSIHNAISHILHLSAAGEYIDRILQDLEEHGIREDGSTELDLFVKLRLNGWSVSEVSG